MIIKTKILYVEDDPDIRAVAEMALEYDDFELIICESGKQALERAKSCIADLLLLDVMMPELDGPSTLLKLREFLHFAKIPVIFMTAKVQPAEINQYKDLGAIGVIKKPFDPMTLGSQIRTFLSAHTQSRHSEGNVVLGKLKDDTDLFNANKLLTLQKQFRLALPSRLTEIEQTWKNLIEKYNVKTHDDLIRYTHSLGGSAATFGYAELGKKSLLLESILQQLATPLVNVEDNLQIEVAIQEMITIARAEPLQTLTFQVPVKYLCFNKKKINSDFTVYFLEDDVSLAKDTVIQLENFNYKLLQFNDLKAVKAAMANKTPDALLLDINLKEGRTAGCDFANELRAEGLSDVPIIFMSAYDGWDDRLRAVRAKGSAFLTKPVNFDELAEILDVFSGRTVESPYRVLIVDDSALLAEHYSTVLATAGIEVIVLTEPQNILSRLIEFRPDLILMDVYMPDCNGIEVASVIRQQTFSTNIPIVYLSTETNIQKQLEALEVGGDDFLVKPIDDVHLLSSVVYKVKRFRQLNALMNTDSMTGLLNHINLKLTLERELNLIQRRKGELSFMMLDIDNFKHVNDTYGHQVGDRVLKSLARILKHRLRNSDIVARYGGEEFAAVLLDTSIMEAKKIIDSIRQIFSETIFTHDETSFSVTFSAGIASSKQSSAVSSIITLADFALYEAKNNGRNQIVTAKTTDFTE